MMIVLIHRRNYKCYWDKNLVHVLLIDGGLLTLEEAEG